MSGISDRPASTLHLSITARDAPAGAQAPAVVRISVAGDLDRCTAPALEACLRRLLRSAACATLTVDLARTDFLDVGGLNVLIAAAQRASATGQPLRLVGCSRHVLRLIQIVEAVDLFDTAADGEQPSRPTSDVAHDCPHRLAVGQVAHTPRSRQARHHEQTPAT